MVNYNNINGTSNEAVVKATGKGWQEWCELLDSLGAAKMDHKQIAQMLHDKDLIKSGWWRQQVTVGYEHARGRRVVGQTAYAGFEVGVTRTLPISAKDAWQLLLTPPGLEVWLGKVNNDFTFQKGARYHTADGITGEIRSFEEGQKLRLTWQPKRRKTPTTLQIYIEPAANQKASVGFHQEKLLDAAEREAMREHWQKALALLAGELHT